MTQSLPSLVVSAARTSPSCPDRWRPDFRDRNRQLKTGDGPLEIAAPTCGWQAGKHALRVGGRDSIQGALFNVRVYSRPCFAVAGPRTEREAVRAARRRPQTSRLRWY